MALQLFRLEVVLNTLVSLTSSDRMTKNKLQKKRRQGTKAPKKKALKKTPPTESRRQPQEVHLKASWIREFQKTFRNTKNLEQKLEKKIFGLRNLDSDTLIYRVVPHFIMEVMRKYFRLQVEGIENIPKRGPVIIAPNHSGYSGFDAFVLAYIIQKEARRVPRVLTHYFWFLNKTTAILAHKLGFTEATYVNGLKELSKRNVLILFPEGEHGNFKPSNQMYQLQEFKRGFVRMALESQATIVPTIVVGAEETHINLSQLKFTKFLRGLVIPLPLNFIPLPAKWKIRFLEPVQLPFAAESLEDSELVHEICSDIQDRMQKALNEELKHRGRIYF